MQLALNVVVFVIGFSLAGILRFRPKETRAALDDILAKLRYVTNALASKRYDELDPTAEKQHRWQQQLAPACEKDMLSM